MMFSNGSFFIFCIWIFILECSSNTLYLSDTCHTWADTRSDGNCTLAHVDTSPGLLPVGNKSKLPDTPTLAWFNNTRLSSHSVWINMTGCIRGNLTGCSSKPRTNVGDPLVECLNYCKSGEIFFTSTECYCSDCVSVNRTALCKPQICGNDHNRLCGNSTECMCGYEKTNITTNETGDCMSTKLTSKDTFVNIATNCSDQQNVLCSMADSHSILFEKNTWNSALTTCIGHEGSSFTGVHNGSKFDANLHPQNETWTGMFRIEIEQLECMAINISHEINTTTGIYCLIPQNCDKQLKSLCINQTEPPTTASILHLSTASSVISQQQESSTGQSSVQTSSAILAGSTKTTASSRSTDNVQSYESTNRETSPNRVVSSTIKTCSDAYRGGIGANMDTTVQETIPTTDSSRTTQTKVRLGQDHDQKPSASFPVVPVVAGSAGGLVFVIVSVGIVVIVYKRRRKHESAKPMGNSSNFRETDQDGNSDSMDSLVHVTNTNVNGGPRDNHAHGRNSNGASFSNREYDHFETFSNSINKVVTKSNDTYDHLGKQGTPTSGERSSHSTYDTFSRSKDTEGSMSVPDDDYDHAYRPNSVYARIQRDKVASDYEGDYDHASHIEGVQGQDYHTGQYDRFKPRQNVEDAYLNEANYDHMDAKWRANDPDKNIRNDNYHEGQYDHFPGVIEKGGKYPPQQGDYDNAFMYKKCDNFDTKTSRNSVDRDVHVTEL